MRSLFCFTEIVQLSEVRVFRSCLSSKNFKKNEKNMRRKQNLFVENGRATSSVILSKYKYFRLYCKKTEAAIKKVFLDPFLILGKAILEPFSSG